MPYSNEWFVKPRVIYTRLIGDISLDTMREQDTECVEFMRQTEDLVHMIVDLREMQGTPLNAIKLRQVITALDQPNMGWLITITSNPTLKFLGNLISQINTKTRNRMMASVEDALAFLQEQDKTVDWSQVEESVFH